MSEGFFDDHPPPVLTVFLHQSSACQLFYRRAEKLSRGGQVVQVIAVSGMVFVDLVEHFLQPGIESLIAHVAAKVIHAADEPLPNVRIDFVGGKLLDVVRRFLAEVFGGERCARDSDDGELARQQIVFRQIVECGNQLAASEVAARAENHHDARIAKLADPLRFQLGV